jgi:hypothetical protein
MLKDDVAGREIKIDVTHTSRLVQREAPKKSQKANFQSKQIKKTPNLNGNPGTIQTAGQTSS